LKRSAVADRMRERLLRPPPPPPPSTPRAEPAPGAPPQPGDGDAELGREMERLVGVLWSLETGAAAAELPRHTACWFLDHASRFRATVAFAAVRLVAALLEGADEELRTRAVTALIPFADLYPERVEELLLSVVEERGLAIRAAHLEALCALLAVQPHPMLLVERWIATSPAARRAVAAAQELLRFP
jgi:hypothetical protein